MRADEEKTIKNRDSEKKNVLKMFFLVFIGFFFVRTFGAKKNYRH